MSGGDSLRDRSSSAIVLVIVTTFSVQCVFVKFPESERQLVEVDFTTIVHFSGSGVRDAQEVMGILPNCSRTSGRVSR
jgi:hypothetical protein